MADFQLAEQQPPLTYNEEEYGAAANNLPACTSEKYYLSTAIAYTNGYPHIGHAYEFLTSDILVRYNRILGKNCFFLTGTDEHGQKVAASADKAGRTPKEHCDHYVAAFQDLHKKLLISYNDFIRTTDFYHEETSRRLWERCAAKGDIYLDAYEGWYNEREEVFVPNAEAEAAEFKDVGSGLPLKRVTEESYFFRMGNYCQALIDHIQANPSFVEPETQRVNILSRLQKEGLKDLSVSRTSFTWGIAVPAGFDPKHVMYVWFDALSNYLSGVHALDEGHPLADFWPAQHHIIGKDIVWFHCVIWPCILLSAGLPLPKTVFSHGFVNAADGRKMSKSYNNTVDPLDLLRLYSVDSLRYYISSSITYGADLNFSEETLIAMHNNELADVLGNLVHRVLTLSLKYCDGVVPDVHPLDDDDSSVKLPFDLANLKLQTERGVGECAINEIVGRAMEAARATNRYLTEAEPWKIKGQDAASQNQRRKIVRMALEAVYAFSHFLAPILPVATHKIFGHLNTPPRPLRSIRDDFRNLTPGTPISIGEILFQKIEESVRLNGSPVPAAVAAQTNNTKTAKPTKGAAEVKEVDHPISFTKMDLRVGRIVSVKPHETSARLYCEEVDVGEGAPRPVVSALRDYYSEEELLNRKVVVVCNLKESRFQGALSAAMVLAAKDDSNTTRPVELVDPPTDSEIGESIALPGYEDFAGREKAWASSRVKKTKVWEEVVPALSTNADGVVVFQQSLPLGVKNGGRCTVPTLINAKIQ
eukprot:gene1164-1271_t